MENQIKLISLYEILGEENSIKYRIPSYQRGYKWNSEQVELLLNDIWEFVVKKKNKEVSVGEFYCLQPIVVKKNGEYFDIIDGQQRLTTVKLIIKYFTKFFGRTIEEFYEGRKDFTIEYETRKETKDFIDNVDKLTSKEEQTKNIDFYFISEAYSTIEKWFSKLSYDDKDEFRKTLLQKEDFQNPVKIILYEVFDENTYEIFSRLNIGKIKLTNSELIKALFLKKWNKKEKDEVFYLKQLQIATDWNYIESRFQNDELWLYISDNRQKYENRIEFIFDLLSDKTENSQFYHTFYFFNKKYFINDLDEENLPKVEKVWENVKKEFLKIIDWFEDREMFHFVGYLIATGDNLKKINEYYNEIDDDGNRIINSKEDFKKLLKRKIIDQKINLTEVELNDLSYGDTKVFNVLLLFNILTLIDSSTSEFFYPFHLHKKQDWDIEHIRSQTDKTISGDKEWYDWMNDIFQFFTGIDLHNISEQDNFDFSEIESPEIKSILENILNNFYAEKINKISLQVDFKELQNYFKEDKGYGETDSISNLALLDSYTNRSYKNAFFPIKRQRIKENENNGLFTPICTRNVFMKFYSQKLEHIMYWQESDANSYMKAIENKLQPFLK